MKVITIQNIGICPVKSMGTVKLDEAYLTPGGILGDRQFAVGALSPNGTGEYESITRREKPLLAIFNVDRIDSTSLILSYPDHGERRVPIESNSTDELIVCHYQHKSIGLDCGNEISDWLTEILEPHKGAELRLFQFVRPHMTVKKDYSGNCIPSGFLDRHPITIAGAQSLDALNSYLGELNLPKATMEQFAPSLTVADFTPFEEHDVALLSHAHFQLRLDEPIQRCAYINVTVDTGENLGAKGPLKHLKKGHPKGEVIFGECASIITNEEVVKINPGLQLSVQYKPREESSINLSASVVEE
jgi:MOSC domain-containing protein